MGFYLTIGWSIWWIGATLLAIGLMLLNSFRRRRLALKLDEIERAVILAPGPEIGLDALEGELVQPGAGPDRPAGAGQPATLADVERAHILAVLAQTNWVVAGRHGAAARLGLKRSTLQHRMKKLGIARRG